MGPYARQTVDWHVAGQTTDLSPRVPSSNGDSRQPQRYHEQHHIFKSSKSSCQSFYPHSSYHGSTTIANILGQHWSRKQKHDHQHHDWIGSRYQYPSVGTTSDINQGIESDEKFIERIGNLVATSNSQKSVQADISSLQSGKVYRLTKKEVGVSKPNFESTTKKPRFEDLLFRKEGTSANPQGIPSSSTPNVNDANKRQLFTYKTWDSSEDKWRPTKIYTAKDARKNMLDQDATASHYFHIPLSRGGKLNIFPNLIDPKRVNRVKKEILASNFWRKYSIQGGDEPRLHFLAHEDATDEFEDKIQPGYRYANITMKARPLSSVPKLQELSKDLADLRQIPDGKWNIGIHPVLYRDNKDSMGDHADDDQGETRIFCVILDSPPTPRKVIIKVFNKLTGGNRERDRVHQEGDEFIELSLRPGDAYEMDGIMQKSYSHCVPKHNGNENTKTTGKRVKNRRICVVLRTGDQKHFEKDTGEPCVDLSPRPPIKYTYGHIEGLQEGKLYTRRELKKMNAFQLPQRGISGSYESGADAIIVSGKRGGSDNIENLRYVAEWRIGANSLVISFLKKSLVRVFRSSKYLRGHNLGATNYTSPSYRYDGLYRIVHMQAPNDPLGAFEFYLKRGSEPCHPKPPLKFYIPKSPSSFIPKSSFEDTAKEFSRYDRKRKIQPRNDLDHSRKRAKWARAIGAKGFSCCANLLLLGKDCIHNDNND